MNIQKLLATTVLTVAVGTMATASQDVYEVKRCLIVLAITQDRRYCWFKDY